MPRARPCLGGGRSNGARGHKYRGDLRSAPTRPPPGPVAGRPSRPLYDDTGPFCPPIALGRAPGGGGSAAWAGGTIGASLAHGDLLNTCLGWPGTVGRPYSAAGLGSGGAPRPCGAAPRGDPTKRPSAGRCGTIGAIWRFRGVGPRVQGTVARAAPIVPGQGAEDPGALFHTPFGHLSGTGYRVGVKVPTLTLTLCQASRSCSRLGLS